MPRNSKRRQFTRIKMTLTLDQIFKITNRNEKNSSQICGVVVGNITRDTKNELRENDDDLMKIL